MNNDYEIIAKNLLGIPRLISKAKKQLFTLEEFASLIKEVAENPDEHTSSLVDYNGGLRCGVCKIFKDHFYFRDDQQTLSHFTRACRYCTWCIKTLIDKEYRRKKELPPKPSAIDVNQGFYRNYNSQIKKHLLNYKQIETTEIMNRSHLNWRAPLDCYYSPNPPENESWFSNKNIDNLNDKNKIHALWNSDCDAILGWFLIKYGLFVSAFFEDIKNEVSSLFNFPVIWDRYFEYFLYFKIYKKVKLWNVYISDFNKRGSISYKCEACRKKNYIVSIKPDFIRWSDGVILPLCNDHWTTLQRTLYPSIINSNKINEYYSHIKSIFGTHYCPICQNEHTWKDKTYEYTKSFYGVPPYFHEICFNCLDIAINQNYKKNITKTDLDCFHQISNIIGSIPSKNMFEVLFVQSKKLDTASRTVRIMKEMNTFEKIIRKYGSWFAVLVRSGCLPEGARKEHYGTRVLSKDGHECLSFGEMHLDNMMHKHSLKHKKEVSYPNSNMVCDWVIELENNKIYVEYFGLLGNEDYDKKIEMKRLLAKENRLTLIEFYPFDFQDLEKSFREKVLCFKN